MVIAAAGVKVPSLAEPDSGWDENGDRMLTRPDRMNNSILICKIYLLKIAS